jgi:16S rRNA (adenine1518-N6/adenine1519-N6)-dimethyltransferase
MASAKKRFGQNFLIDPRKADGLVAALDIAESDTIVEVGPGTGVLSERILIKGARLISVELDKDLIGPLRVKFDDNANFKLIEGDIIKFNPGQFAPHDFKLIGNLPYNISGAMIEWLINYHDMVRLAIITVQKEVAMRLRASPGSRDYGSLSVMVQSFFDIKRLFDIPPGCFSPKPKVYSTALSLTPNKKIPDDIEYPRFRDFLRACFARKRKTLVNSLGAADELAMNRTRVDKVLADLGFRPDIRAEQLTLSDFLKLYSIIGL